MCPVNPKATKATMRNEVVLAKTFYRHTKNEDLGIRST